MHTNSLSKYLTLGHTMNSPLNIQNSIDGNGNMGMFLWHTNIFFLVRWVNIYDFILCGNLSCSTTLLNTYWFSHTVDMEVNKDFTDFTIVWWHHNKRNISCLLTLKLVWSLGQSDLWPKSQTKENWTDYMERLNISFHHPSIILSNFQKSYFIQLTPISL